MLGETPRPHENLINDLEIPPIPEKKPAPRAPSGETSIEMLHARQDLEETERDSKTAEAAKIEKIRQSIDNIDNTQVVKETSPWDENEDGVRMGGSAAEVQFPEDDIDIEVNEAA